MITMLVVLAVLLFRVCVSAALSACMRQQDEVGVGSRRDTCSEPPPPTGWPGLAAVSGLTLMATLLERRATVDRRPAEGPQDAPLGTPWVAPHGPQDAATGLQDAVLTSSAASVRRRDAAAGPAAEPTRQRATLETACLDALTRPTAGPPCLGGREDGAYLGGWDDAVDGVRRGHAAQGPRWGSAAYMTGWNDGMRAVARARAGRLG